MPAHMWNGTPLSDHIPALDLEHTSTSNKHAEYEWPVVSIHARRLRSQQHSTSCSLSHEAGTVTVPSSVRVNLSHTEIARSIGSNRPTGNSWATQNRDSTGQGSPRVPSHMFIHLRPLWVPLRYCSWPCCSAARPSESIALYTYMHWPLGGNRSTDHLAMVRQHASADSCMTHVSQRSSDVGHACSFCNARDSLKVTLAMCMCRFSVFSSLRHPALCCTVYTQLISALQLHAVTVERAASSPCSNCLAPKLYFGTSAIVSIGP